MVWKGAAGIHGRIEAKTVWDTIRWAQCDNRNAGHKNADDDKQDYIFPGKIHIIYTIVLVLILYYIVAWGQGFYEFGDHYIRSLSHSQFYWNFYPVLQSLFNFKIHFFLDLKLSSGCIMKQKCKKIV